MTMKEYEKAYNQMLTEESDYVKNTGKFLSDLISSDNVSDDIKKYLKGLKNFLDKNGSLTPDQQNALSKIKDNLEK